MARHTRAGIAAASCRWRLTKNSGLILIDSRHQSRMNAESGSMGSLSCARAVSQLGARGWAELSEPPGSVVPKDVAVDEIKTRCRVEPGHSSANV